MSIARNNAMRVSRGDYIAFIDADDVVVPDYIEKLEALLGDERPQVIALTTRTMPRRTVFGFGDYCGNASGFLRAALANKHATFPCWAFVVSRSLISENGLEFVAGRRTGEDQEFVLKALLLAKTCVSVGTENVFYVYESNRRGSAMSINIEGQFDYPMAMEEVLRFARKQLLLNRTGSDVLTLLANRCVDACHYATQVAIENGAGVRLVAPLVDEVLNKVDFSFFNDRTLNRVNRRFLLLWRGGPVVLWSAMRVELFALHAGRKAKDALSRMRLKEGAKNDPHSF